MDPQFAMADRVMIYFVIIRTVYWSIQLVSCGV